jgi:hypothetical protein
MVHVLVFLRHVRNIFLLINICPAMPREHKGKHVDVMLQDILKILQDFLKLLHIINTRTDRQAE